MRVSSIHSSMMNVFKKTIVATSIITPFIIPKLNQMDKNIYIDNVPIHQTINSPYPYDSYFFQLQEQQAKRNKRKELIQKYKTLPSRIIRRKYKTFKA